jgi:hypothetical protein
VTFAQFVVQGGDFLRDTQTSFLLYMHLSRSC